MKNREITISDNGTVNVPTNVKMKDFEIANLLGVMVPTVRGGIKRLMKSRMGLNCSGGIVSGNSIIPEYFGLEVVIAVAFQVDSYKANIFRKLIMSKLTQINVQPIYIGMNDVKSNIFN